MSNLQRIGISVAAIACVLALTPTSEAASNTQTVALVQTGNLVSMQANHFQPGTTVRVVAKVGTAVRQSSVTVPAGGVVALDYRIPSTVSGTMTVSVGTATKSIVLAKAAAATAGTRDIYAWPYAWNSIWNLPLAQSAKLANAGLDAKQVYIDYEDISVNPAFPLKSVSGGEVKSAQVHVDPNLTGDGSWNNCAAFLSSDGTTVIQGQPLKLSKGGNPTWDDGKVTDKLTGLGIAGCHGGSGLAGLGGDIRGGELTSPQPIRHVIKLGLGCQSVCSQANGGHRWPATKSDGGFDKQGDGNFYGGSNPQVQMWSLLALPKNADLNFIIKPDVKKVALALQTYGAYVVDTTAGKADASIDVQRGYENELPNVNSSEMTQLIRMLQVVTNNTQQTPGGGALGTPRVAACAPPFKNGTGGAPAGC